jgi:hypothetical protein
MTHSIDDSARIDDVARLHAVCGHPSRRTRACARMLLRMRAAVSCEASTISALVLRGSCAIAHERLEGRPQILIQLSNSPTRTCVITHPVQTGAEPSAWYQRSAVCKARTPDPLIILPIELSTQSINPQRETLRVARYFLPCVRCASSQLRTAAKSTTPSKTVVEPSPPMSMVRGISPRHCGSTS